MYRCCFGQLRGENIISYTVIIRSQWNPDTALHEGHIVSAQELTELLQPAFSQNARNLILFLQDTLSVDDFTYLSEAYGNKNPFQNVQASTSFLYFFIYSI
ncbi:v-type proton atpase subunit s1 [Limosa lapponica baueri]|uniref:V-type proton atpase subunit s1 n=1 Tax=Limosa lapponica baueri TaxID=1758121 RepID=A0A2I0UII5_LIMLA|nr:v-type proton atpase subunit s1 [Limosa lapponica baueri]